MAETQRVARVVWNIEYHESGEVKRWTDKRDIKTILLAFLKMIEDEHRSKSKNN